jgi:hypothetical protein
LLTPVSCTPRRTMCAPTGAAGLFQRAHGSTRRRCGARRRRDQLHAAGRRRQQPARTSGCPAAALQRGGQQLPRV